MKNQKTKKTIKIWKEKINQALTTGKGPYKDYWVSDLFFYKRTISLIESGKFSEAYELVLDNIDSITEEGIPRSIRKLISYSYYSRRMKKIYE